MKKMVLINKILKMNFNSKRAKKNRRKKEKYIR
jgi:hypothetical protein